MKENKKDILNLDETKELNTLSNDNICEIIEMAINDIKDLYDHMNNLQFEDDIENIEDDKEVRDSLDEEFNRYFMPLFGESNTSNKILIH